MSLASGQLAILTKTLFDALDSRDADLLLTTPLYVLGLSLIAGVARYFSMFYAQYMTDCVSVNLRRRTHAKLMDLNLTYHNTFESGSGGILSRILNDVNQIENGLRSITDFFREPILFVFLMGWLFYLDWRLTGMLFLVLPVLMKFLRQIARSLQKYGRQSQREMEDLTTNIKEGLEGIRVIQSFNLEKEMSARFQNIADRFLLARRRIQSRTELAGPVTEMIATTVIVALFIYMGLKITEGTSSLGDFASYLASILMMQKPVKKMQESYVKMQNALVAGERLYQIIESDSIVKEIAEPKSFPKDWKKIEYRNVSFHYGDKLILKNFNLTINRGEVVALVGESGSGKSTAVNLLERFFDPTEGQILVDDIPISDLSLKDLRKQIALVTQDVFLFNDTIDYNINTGDLELRIDQVPGAAKAANAHNFISSKDQQYRTRVGDRGNLLSGGEKQRVSIARAFFKNSPIIILDEATSALDSASEVEVQKGLESLMTGRTVLVIAHRLSTVAKADKIIVMRGGQIVESGSHDQLISNKGEYFKFKNLQT